MSKDINELESPVVEVRKSYVIDGGKILCFADTHFSAVYEGEHINYQYECYENMSRILEIVRSEKPKAVVFLGDLIGVREHNINDRKFLMRITLFFGNLFNLTNGNLFVVKGNHDVGDFSDYDFLLGLGYFKNPSYIDYKHNGSTEVRFHFVNYGDEDKKLDICTDGASNVVFGHVDYYIDGVTNWYSKKGKRVELAGLKNFCGVDLVFSGHIHTPSVDVLYTSMGNGDTCGLFYLGSCSRTAERYDDCWYVSFEYNEEEESTDYKPHLFGLRPAKEVFYDSSSFVNNGESEESEDEERRKTEALNFVIEEIFNSRLATGDLFGQIDKIPADADVKELAKEYLNKAMNGGSK